MSLDVYLYEKDDEVHSQNITHNLARMASEAGFYNALWRPEESGILSARQLAESLKSGIEKMEAEPERFKPLSASNGWGTYEQFLPWLYRLLKACNEYPNAAISVSG